MTLFQPVWYATVITAGSAAELDVDTGVAS